MRRHVTASPAESTGRSGLRLLVCFTVAIGVMALLVPSAIAFQRHPYTGTSFGPDGVGGSASFTSVQDVAVDHGNGDVYVYDSSAGKVYKFNAAGEPVNFSALGGNAIGGPKFAKEIAVAPSGAPGATAGDIYVATNSAVQIFSASGSPLGELTGSACGVAVSPAGHVFVGTPFPSVVREYVPTANPVSSGDLTGTSTAALPTICNVAADGLGNVYAANYEGREAVKLEGIGDTSASQLDSRATGLAVNPASNEVYVDRGAEFAQYDSSGNLVGTSGAGAMAESHGIAVDASSDKVYVGNGNSQKVDVFGPAITLPSAVSGAATGVTKNGATLNGTINPAGTATTYQFEYGPNKRYGNTIPVSPALVGSDEADHQFSAEISGLQPNSTYNFRIIATNANGTNRGKDSIFTTSNVLTPETTGSPVRTATSARLDARVGSLATGYYFEYGTQGPCDANPCTATNPQPAGSATGIRLVSQVVEGLSPGTTYHYRVIATDGSPESPAAGGDMTVTTRASDAPLTHGRFAGPAGSDRAWEQINVPDTGGNPVGNGGNSSFGLFFSEDGDRSVYPLRGGTPTSDTGSAYSIFFSERTAQGWQDNDIKPPRSELVGGLWSPQSNVATPDLSVVASANINLGNGAAAIWRLSPQAPPAKLWESSQGQNFFEGGSLGLSANGSRVVANISGEVDPAYPSLRQEEIYDISSATPHLASLLPNGQPCSGINRDKLPVAPTRWVTDDGSRLFFPCDGALYVHDFETGQSKFLSGCKTSRIPGGDLIGTIPGAAFFITENALSAEDTTLPGSACGSADIYRFDFSSEEFDCLTCVLSRQAEVASGPEAAGAAGVAAVSTDGSRVYFVSSNELIPGAAKEGIYRLDVASGNLAYVGSAAGREEATLQTNRDGSALIFYGSAASLNAAGGQQNGGTPQVYHYDDRDRSLVCMSCPTDGSAPSYPVEIPYISELPIMSTDGETVTFATPSPLSRLDQNTATSEQPAKIGTDVYEWRDGRLFLVSDGLSEWASSEIEEVLQPVPAAVSPSGRDIYFMATAQYTPDALDGYRRLYDARIGGGFEFPPPPKPCPLEVCQGTPKGAPEEQAPGTGTFEGAAKAPARHHKAKKHRKKRHHRSAKKTQRANHNRRTAR